MRKRMLLDDGTYAGGLQNCPNISSSCLTWHVFLVRLYTAFTETPSRLSVGEGPPDVRLLSSAESLTTSSAARGYCHTPL